MRITRQRKLKETPKAKAKAVIPAWKGGARAVEAEHDKKLSKALSTFLRHQASGLVRPDGYCRVSDLMRHKDFKKVSLSDIEECVRENDKQRFELAQLNGSLHIRAVQGHSMPEVEDELLLRRLSLEDQDLPEVCLHGTYRQHIASIKKLGLVAGGVSGKARKHIHFTQYMPGDGRVISGMRGSCECVVYVDLRKALEDDIPFYMSTNEVLLSPGIKGVLPSKYFCDIRHV